MVVALFALSIGIVKFFAEPGFPFHTSFTVVICYFCSFGILLTIPPDIATAVVERNRTSSLDGYYNSIEFFSVFYNTLFVIILVMGSVVLVFQEYYNTDGEFATLTTWFSMDDKYDKCRLVALENLCLKLNLISIQLNSLRFRGHYILVKIILLCTLLSFPKPDIYSLQIWQAISLSLGE